MTLAQELAGKYFESFITPPQWFLEDEMDPLEFEIAWLENKASQEELEEASRLFDEMLNGDGEIPYEEPPVVEAVLDPDGALPF